MHTQRLLEDILVTYQNKSKECQLIDYNNTAAVILLDKYCQCPTSVLVSVCYIYKWFPFKMCTLKDDDMHNWIVHLVSLVLNWLYEMNELGIS